MTEKVSISALKGISVLYEGDIYDLACLLLKVDDAKDRGTNTRSRYTVHGLASIYSMIAHLNPDEIEDILKGHGLPLGATVEYDKDVT